MVTSIITTCCYTLHTKNVQFLTILHAHKMGSEGTLQRIRQKLCLCGCIVQSNLCRPLLHYLPTP